MSGSMHKMLEGVGRLASLADVEEVLAHLARLLRKTVQARWSAVFFLDRQRRDFSSPYCFGIPERLIPLLTRHFLVQGLPGVKKMLRRSRGAFLEGEPVHLLPEQRKLLASHHFAAIPMVIRNEVTGVALIARSRRSHPPFSKDEVALARDVVGHAALVISHIRLFDESLDTAMDLARRIDMILTLDEINKAISSSLSRKKILDTAMTQIRRITGCAALAVLREEGGTLRVIASHAATEGAAEVLKPETAPPIGQCAALTAFKEGKSIIRNDIRRNGEGSIDDILFAAGMRSIAAVPLESKGRTGGVLLLADPQPGKFPDEDIFTLEKIAAQMAVALENARLYEDLRELFFGTVTSLANAIDAKSPWTKGHSERVMRTAGTIARLMGLPEEVVERVKIGGLLHDVGKIGIIEAVLEKPGQLSELESPAMRLHPQKGVGILSPISQLKDVLPGILHHHERWDGTGYPSGLKGSEIPLEARIICVADSFDAMVAVRPYKQGRPVVEAIRELNACAGTQFDPAIVEYFSRYVTGKLNLPGEIWANGS